VLAYAWITTQEVVVGFTVGVGGGSGRHALPLAPRFLEDFLYRVIVT
jgi:hypothetical protein